MNEPYTNKEQFDKAIWVWKACIVFYFAIFLGILYWFNYHLDIFLIIQSLALYAIGINQGRIKPILGL